jgi:hypothetical protein
MLDLHEGVASLFAEAERRDERRFDAVNRVWRELYRSGRWSGVAIPPLPFPMCCRFCRRGCHHEAHFGACSRAPTWARRHSEARRRGALRA